MFFFALINNITLIIALSILYSFIIRRWKYGSRTGRVISGFLFGAVAIVGMMNPLVISPGLIFDGRSIIISIAGFLGGWVTALIAALMAIIYRAWLGGPGAIMGVSVIVSSAVIGIAYHYIRRHKPHVVTPLYLIGFGIIVHICMLALTMTLPSSMKYEVLSNIAIPVILIYPLGTLLVCVVLLDLESRLSAEETLLESTGNFRRSLDESPLGVRIVTSEGETIYANLAILDFYGYDSIEEFNTTSVKKRYTEESYVEFQTRRQKRKKGVDVPSKYTIDITRKNGDVRHLQVYRKEILWNGERQYQVVYQDQTERKLAEDALRESEAKFRTLFESANDAIFLMDKDIFIDCNPKTLEMFGCTREQIIGQPPYLFSPEAQPDGVKSREKSQEKITRAFSGQPQFFEWKHSRYDGTLFDSEVSLSEFSNMGKYYLQAIVRDITARKQAEEEKKILQERLQQADKMEAIGTLAGGIAHDFNNLLMGIQGYASMTLMNIDPSNPNYERLKRIEEQVQSGADLTSQLLGFARGGRYEVKPTDINEIIEKTSSMFGRTKKEIAINRKTAKDLWNVEVDRGQMEQVFLNLYVNAWQAMPGGGDIYLETQNVLLNDEKVLPFSGKPGKHVKITITDTGTGMDEKTKERIFDPFFTTKAMGRGTGLGLATVYGIIKGHHGMINVYSEPGHGTTFTIYLPASDKEIPKEKAPIGEIITGTETILLVDDEKMVLEVNRELLESMGYKVYGAGSGQEGIAIYAENKDKIDLVILDMIMPGISGSETFDRLREINPDIKVLLSSGYSLNGEAQTIMDRGCNGFLQKPFRLEELSGKVREMLM